eukprot:GHVN01074466.1.p1 GENE.GHVN01074466.1~~GHVN01074466.1.p1  ORF type:complete len:226 (+),score=8.91 GHVN01074466.1:108-785(+)
MSDDQQNEQNEQNLQSQQSQQSQQQQQQSIDDQLRTGQWSHGLCGCFDNLAVCIVGYFVPCVTFGQTSEKMTNGEKSCALYGCLYIVPILGCVLEMNQRAAIRAQRGIPGSGCNDFMLILCCPLCTLVQEEQEAIALTAQRAGLQGGTGVHYVAPGGAIIFTHTGAMQTTSTYPPPQGQAYQPPQGQGYQPPQGYQQPPQQAGANPPPYDNVYPNVTEIEKMDRS